MGTLRFRQISSDDPNALADLTAKVKALEALQERMKKANTVIRGNTTVAAKVAGLGALGITETEAYRLLRPDFAGYVGYPSWQLRNNNAEIRRVRARIVELAERRSEATREWRIAGATVTDNVEENRIQLFFSGKPAEDIRRKLRRAGFIWAPSIGAWQRKRGPNALWAAGHVLGTDLAKIEPESPASVA